LRKNVAFVGAWRTLLGKPAVAHGARLETTEARPEAETTQPPNKKNAN
jgi:hypothetical protein